MPSQPTVTVLDLTARIGLYALAQLGAPIPAGSPLHNKHWPQLALVDAPGAPKVDWHRPQQAPDLAGTAPDAAATVVLVGPGSIPLLQAALALDRVQTSPAVWFFLLPNAIMEDIAIRTAMQTLPALQAQIFQLPDSSPQTLWFILMEQLDKLQVLSHATPLNPDGTPMTTNLKDSMNAAMAIDGATAVALVDYRSGMCLAQAGSGMNLDLAAAGNTQVVQAKLKTIESLGLRKGIEDILITLSDQYHLIRLVPNNQGLFLYLVLDKNRGNLALARYKLTEIERTLKV